MPSTTASISSPALSTSEGLLMRLVHDNSLTCTSPSTPGSSSMNAPYGMRLTTLPDTLPPMGYFSSILSHGLASFCFKPRLTRSFSLLMSSTTTSSSWPVANICEGCVMRPQLMSVMCSRPSRPFRSMNAPKSVRFFTVPLRMSPGTMSSRSFARLAERSSSINSRRLSTMFCRSRLSFITLKS